MTNFKCSTPVEAPIFVYELFCILRNVITCLSHYQVETVDLKYRIILKYLLPFIKVFILCLIVLRRCLKCVHLYLEILKQVVCIRRK